MATGNKVPERLVNFRVYNEGNDLLGVATVDLPSIEAMSDTVSGAGIAGEVESPGRCQPFFPLIYKVLHLCFLRGSAPSAFGGFPRGFLGPQRCSLWRAVGFLQCAV